MWHHPQPLKIPTVFLSPSSPWTLPFKTYLHVDFDHVRCGRVVVLLSPSNLADAGEGQLTVLRIDVGRLDWRRSRRYALRSRSPVMMGGMGLYLAPPYNSNPCPSSLSHTWVAMMPVMMGSMGLYILNADLIDKT